jgi:hypothetical protein
VKLLPQEFVSYLDKTIAFVRANVDDYPNFNTGDVAKLERIREWMLAQDVGNLDLNHMRSDFYRFVNEYDKRRGTNFLETFPEYKSFYELCASVPQNWNESTKSGFSFFDKFRR